VDRTLAPRARNLRAAFDWLEAAHETELLQRLGGALARFWLMQGHAREGGERLERALGSDDSPSSSRLKALNGAAMLGQTGAHGRRHATAALALAEALGDRRGAAQAKLALGSAISSEDMPATRDLYQDAAELYSEVGDEHMLMVAIRSLAWACLELGDAERGRALHEQNLQRARRLGNTRLEAITLGALSTYHIEDGQLDIALPLLLESHQLHEQVDDPMQTAFDIFRFAMFLTAADMPTVAATVLAAADARAADAGITLTNWDPVVRAILGRLRDRLGADTFDAAWERGRELTAAQAFGLAVKHSRLPE